ncbi:MAG: hypothetical protein IJ713_02585 [Oscillibacter sp.]|nr:hypothetical protein [Oscillibacter sp.]
MKHPIIPFADQTVNPAIDRNDPQAAATAIELQFPKTFSTKAWRVIRYMEGAMYLYSYKGKFVATDESLELTEYGDGSHEAPYGAPRFVCNTLDEMEETLEELADFYDESYDIPGWEPDMSSVSEKAEWHEPSPNVMVKLIDSHQFIAVKTYCRKLGSRGRFLIFRSTLRDLLSASAGETRYEEDCGDYVKITRLKDALHFSFTWLSTYSGGVVKGNRQVFTVPIYKLRLLLDWKDDEKHLYIPAASAAKIVLRPANLTVREIVKDKRIRRAFSKAMRDCFRWPGEIVHLYRDGMYNFYFTTESGFPKYGGLILHEGMRNGRTYLYYSVHT